MKKRLFKTLVCFSGMAGMILAAFMPVASHASTETDFINSIKEPVVTVSHKNHLYASVMMAQAILESNWGQSELALDGNNYFGIKGAFEGNSVTMNTAEYTGKGKRYTVNAQFKKYPSVKESIEDNAKILRNGIDSDPDYYDGTWTENTVSYVDAATALSSKYATDMNYGNKLTKVIQKYDLTKLDSSTSSGSLDINQQIAAGVDDSIGDDTTNKTVQTNMRRITANPDDLKEIDKTEQLFKEDSAKKADQQGKEFKLENKLLKD
ncbi:glycoside hydrolase family 73 protein [Lentilactobacillus kribbianus]|uniref:glycoside hydrolase family 73 protein n=1 Tax=Lentilactobacillus kribbianus TaxID=2729622 RepID=UPI001FE8DFFB|nr:glycoside hydrolase family 73 protein [Lentilactobacillus kribbianus]